MGCRLWGRTESDRTSDLAAAAAAAVSVVVLLLSCVQLFCDLMVAILL